MLTYNGQADSVEAEQVSMVVGANFLTPFQETVGDAFDVIRDRIRNAKGRIRKMGADYLAYSLIDAIVDNYFGILEKLGEKIGSVEEELATSLQESLRLYNTAYGYHRDLPAMTVAAVAMLSHFR